MSLESIVKGLNPSQKEAVTSTKPALIVLAGAGSGKTRVLTRRITHLLAQGLIAPNEFLAVTFTNKAAAEMKERIVDLLLELGFPPPPDMWVSTFHSMGAKILREHIYLLDYPTSFTIYDGDDQIKVIKAILKDLNINDKSVNPKTIRESISKAKGQCIYPHETEKLEQFWILRFQEVYQAYEKKLFDSKALDFSDLLFKTYDVLQSYPAVLEQYQEQFKHILVDEYQDTNALQYKLVHLLAGKKNCLFAVGDEDQSIYSWRGADVHNIQLMEKEFGAHKIKLELNYRSTKNIVEASNDLIQNNTIRNEKTLRTDNPTGDKIILAEANTDYDEAKVVATHIENLIARGEDPSDIAIFYRLNSQSRVLEEQLRMRGIAYKILGGLRFYERKEIKDVLAFMKLTVNPTDEISLLRVINVPTRGIGKKTIETLIENSKNKGITLLESIKSLKTEPVLKPGPRKKVLGFLSILERLEEVKDRSASEVYREILDNTDYVLNLKAENNSEAEARIDNLEELDNALSHFENERGDEATLLQFLEEVALISDIDNADFEVRQVTLMTLHVSKGLEFENACIVGLEEGLLPCVHGEEINQDISEVEEERRLMYVGMTRAKKTLHLSFARSRKVWGQEQFYPISRFIKEIPDQYLEKNLIFKQPSSSFGGGWRSKSTFKKPEEIADPFPDYDSDVDEDFFDDEPGFKKGHRVRHPVFGPGKVLETEGNGELMKVKIVFSDRSVKKFVAKYARLERL
jgi:DNA helicase-2/ATP-dependent DNA helicase PcrA